MTEKRRFRSRARRDRSRDVVPFGDAVRAWFAISCPRAGLISVLAFVIAFKLRWSVLRLLGVCAVVGSVFYLVTH